MQYIYIMERRRFVRGVPFAHHFDQGMMNGAPEMRAQVAETYLTLGMTADEHLDSLQNEDDLMRMFEKITQAINRRNKTEFFIMMGNVA